MTCAWNASDRRFCSPGAFSGRIEQEGKAREGEHDLAKAGGVADRVEDGRADALHDGNRGSHERCRLGRTCEGRNGWDPGRSCCGVSSTVPSGSENKP